MIGDKDEDMSRRASAAVSSSVDVMAMEGGGSQESGNLSFDRDLEYGKSVTFY
jgi:hypothetical protein